MESEREGQPGRGISAIPDGTAGSATEEHPSGAREGSESASLLPARVPPLARSAVGVFDSGVGGLTVVRELARQLPGESILYFGDTARVPYGTKSPETIRRFSREAARFLLSREVKMIVVACNTASAHALEELRSEAPVPVVGVVGAGARAAVRATGSGRIGVIGTPGTIRSGAYDRAMRRSIPDVRVFAQACPLFVPLVEEGWATHAAARVVAEEYLAPLREVGIDTLILGCTHYPVLRPLIQDVMGEGVTLIDSAEETAREVGAILTRTRHRNPGEEEPRHHFTVSDQPLRFREIGRRFMGELVGSVEHVEVDEA